MQYSTLWELDLEELKGQSPAESNRFSPYAVAGGESILDAYHAATRQSTKRKQALRHCHAMAEWYLRLNQLPASVDWAISAAHLADDQLECNEAARMLFTILSSTEPTSTSWGDFQKKSQNAKQHQRFCAVSIIRFLSALSEGLKCEFEIGMLEWVALHAADIMRSLEAKPNQNPLPAIRSLHHYILQRTVTLTNAAACKDLPSLLALRSSIQKSLNEATVSAVMSAFLPHGFWKHTTTQLLTLANDMLPVTPSALASHYRSLKHALVAARAELSQTHTYFSRALGLTFVECISRLAAAYFEHSDAAKPAVLELTAIDKKYPFGQSEHHVLLRFLVRNIGNGPATDIDTHFLFQAPFDAVEYQYSINELNRGAASIDIRVTLTGCAASVEWLSEMSWANSDGSIAKRHFSGTLHSQRSDIAWNLLESRDYYSLEPAIDETQFAGREKLLSTLIKATASTSMGSFYVFGQKRVGKTSLVKVFAHRLKAHVTDAAVIYLETGDYIEASVEGTVCRLGRSIYRNVKHQISEHSRLPAPEFNDSLSPIVEFLQELCALRPSLRLLLILDEFDELPVDLYKRGDIGDAFFLTLRSLAGHPHISIILVGGERIMQIVHAQGDKLNKWSPMEVGYFTRESDWRDFCDLITRPTEQLLEFSDDALERLFAWSSGNPYFCNTICRKIVDQCVERRDAYITDSEVEQAAVLTLSGIGPNAFLHFWEDGIVAARSKVEEISIRRRRILLAIANCLRGGIKPRLDIMMKDSVMGPLSPSVAEAELAQFVERRVLIPNNDGFGVRVKLFGDWLRESGPSQNSIRYTDDDEQALKAKSETDLYVTSSEIIAVTESWGNYKGNSIGAEKVRSWLEQFGSNEDQRLMFQLLRQIRFYSQSSIRKKHAEAMDIVKRRTIERKVPGERARRDLIVTAFGGIAKSGTYHARLFCQENRILMEQVCDVHGLNSHLDRYPKAQAVIVVDDIIGTGKSAIQGFEALREASGARVNELNIPIIVISVCGFEEGRVAVEKAVEAMGFHAEIVVCDLLSEEDKAFSSRSEAFLSNNQRSRAKAIAEEKGAQLEPRSPLGFGECQGLVVFEDTCPNNSLPILWKQTKEWNALFPRH